MSATTGSQDPPSPLHHFCANFKAFLGRSCYLTLRPWEFALIIADCWLLLQSTWSKARPGPDLVYPMLSIRKRQSQRLARLLLEHCRNQRSYELRVTPGTFQLGIDPPCVAVMDLDQVSRHIAQNRCSTQLDSFGLVCMLMILETLAALILAMYCLWDKGSYMWANLGLGVGVNLYLCLCAGTCGDLTLMLSRSMDSSPPQCAVFLEQKFTLILSGKDSMVQAIAENGFNLSYNQKVVHLGFPGSMEYFSNSALKGICVGALCYNLYLVVFITLRTFDLAHSQNSSMLSAEIVLVSVAILILFQPAKINSESLQIFLFTMVPPCVCSFIMLWDSDFIIRVLFWHLGALCFSCFMFMLFFKTRSYPIQSAKFIDALGHPPVRKWQFENLSAAATFQCLVLCHGIVRPIKSIDVLAFLDMLIPDETDVWRVWKNRVADRITHEDDILFGAVVPTFRDERQQKLLVELLNHAQFGYDKYKELYARGAPPNAGTTDEPPTPSVMILLFQLCARRLRSCVSSITGNPRLLP